MSLFLLHAKEKNNLLKVKKKKKKKKLKKKKKKKKKPKREKLEPDMANKSHENILY